jgi:hypothetical protein
MSFVKPFQLGINYAQSTRTYRSPDRVSCNLQPPHFFQLSRQTLHAQCIIVSGVTIPLIFLARHKFAVARHPCSTSTTAPEHQVIQPRIQTRLQLEHQAQKEPFKQCVVNQKVKRRPQYKGQGVLQESSGL